ncbi:hypothetical protein Q5752_003050 [Cryptotrichosporon argae]
MPRHRLDARVARAILSAPYPLPLLIADRDLPDEAGPSLGFTRFAARPAAFPLPAVAHAADSDAELMSGIEESASNRHPLTPRRQTNYPSDLLSTVYAARLVPSLPAVQAAPPPVAIHQAPVSASLTATSSQGSSWLATHTSPARSSPAQTGASSSGTGPSPPADLSGYTSSVPSAASAASDVEADAESYLSASTRAPTPKSRRRRGPLFIGQSNIAPFTYAPLRHAPHAQAAAAGFASEAESTITLTRAARVTVARPRAAGRLTDERKGKGKAKAKAKRESSRERSVTPRPHVRTPTPRLASPHPVARLDTPKPRASPAPLPAAKFEALLDGQRTPTQARSAPSPWPTPAAASPPHAARPLWLSPAPQRSPSPSPWLFPAPEPPASPSPAPMSLDPTEFSWPRSLAPREAAALAPSLVPSLAPSLASSLHAPWAAADPAAAPLLALGPLIDDAEMLDPPSAAPAPTSTGHEQAYERVELPLAKACQNFLMLRQMQEAKRRRLARRHERRMADTPGLRRLEGVVDRLNRAADEVARTRGARGSAAAAHDRQSTLQSAALLHTPQPAHAHVFPTAPHTQRHWPTPTATPSHTISIRSTASIAHVDPARPPRKRRRSRSPSSAYGSLVAAGRAGASSSPVPIARTYDVGDVDNMLGHGQSAYASWPPTNARAPFSPTSPPSPPTGSILAAARAVKYTDGRLREIVPPAAALSSPVQIRRRGRAEAHLDMFERALAAAEGWGAV